MTTLETPQYGISEVSELTGVSAHLLRQWESRIPHLKPKRGRGNRRSYSPADVEIVRRIKQLLRYEKLTSKGVIRKLSQELYGEGTPATNQEAVELVDRIESEVRSMLELLDKDSSP